MTQAQEIRTAVFPVAGRGTRFLPATKASPKEMLPIVDKPLIQYAAEEALAAGARKLVFITGSSKRAIEDHFDTDRRAGAGAGGAGQSRPAQGAEGHRAVVGELHLHPPAVAARSRSRRVVREAGRRRRAVLRAPRGRSHRRRRRRACARWRRCTPSAAAACSASRRCRARKPTSTASSRPKSARAASVA